MLETLPHYDRAIKIALALDEKSIAGLVMMNKAGVYADLQNLDTAYQMQLEAKRLKVEGSANSRSLAMSDLNIGQALYALARYDEAEQYLSGCLGVFESLENEPGLANTLTHLGQLKLAQGNASEAVKYCRKGLQKALEVAVVDLQSKACDCLYEAYKRLNDHTNALKYYEEAIKLSDSIRSESNLRQIAQLELNYELEKIENLRAMELASANSLAQEREKRRNVWLAFLALLLTVSVLLAYLAFRNLQTKRRSEALLLHKNKAITKALQDKELLLREIHHRVKNNLQIISSLLRLQSRYIDDDVALDALTAGQNRVQSMALLHENLYEGEDIRGVDLGKYFDRLIDRLFATLNVRPEEITLVKEIESISLDIDSVVPIGLIANELISNALKHAFKASRGGLLVVKLYEQNDTLHLIVQDTGPGLPADFLDQDKGSFGSKLIKAFAAKLRATMTIEYHQGARVHVQMRSYRGLTTSSEVGSKVGQEV